MSLIKIKSQMRFQKLKIWYYKYERYLIPGALLFGIITDFILFQYINISTAFTILTVHVVISGSIIAYLNIYDAGFFNQEKKFLKYLRLFAPLVIQYSFGALLSGFFIFYWFSGVFSASWPFILIIVFLMLSNDLLKKYYLRFQVQIGVYFFIIFSWLVLVLPVVFATIAPWVFVVGSLLSLVLIFGYLRLLAKKVTRIFDEKKLITSIIISVFVLMNILYFTNTIPPIPLSVRGSNVYHYVEKINSDYLVLTENRTFWDKIRPGRRVSVEIGQRLYAFSAVFAPSDFELEIGHHWQYRHPENGWQSIHRLSFPISGGRKEGYRGYSFGTINTPGRYRVDIETQRGQLIGRINFQAVVVDQIPELKTEYR